MDRLHRVFLVVSAIVIVVLAGAGTAYAEPAANPLVMRSLANEKWKHATYFVTGESSVWHGASAKIRTSSLALDGFDDQHEVSLTVYADTRYGETDSGYRVYPTFAVAIMRGWRERQSVGLFSDPTHLNVITLVTAATADSTNGRYIYPRSEGGTTITVQPDEDHTYEVRYSGTKTYVYNDDSLAGQGPYVVDGVPVSTDWLDIRDGGKIYGHMAYRWDAFVDGRLVSSAWLTSDKGWIKVESNKRNAAYAPVGSMNVVTDLRLGYSATSPTSYGPWTRSVPTAVVMEKGDYITRAVTRYTSMFEYMPCAADRPNAAFVKSSNSIAYNLKSFQTTRFSTSVDRPDVWARLSIRLPGTDKVIYDGPIHEAGKTFFFPLWDGKGPGGKPLPSANYDWELRITKSGATRYYTGRITVCRVLFAIRGSAADGGARSYPMYMIPGNANFYLTARSSRPPDVIRVRVAGPKGYAAQVMALDLVDDSSVTGTGRLTGGRAVRAKGAHTVGVSVDNDAAFGMTVIQ